MKVNLLLWTLIIACLTNCNPEKETKKKISNNILNENLEPEDEIVSEEINMTLELDFGFKLEVGQEEDFDKFKTYTFFKLSKNNQTVFIDSSLTEYEFGDKLYPIILGSGKNRFELIFEVNNRPNKNYLKRLIVFESRIIAIDKLPTFISKPVDINNDGIKEYAGFWDYNQTWGKNYSFTAYNPILYYSVMPNGLQLDSLLTKERNEYIYGQFHGFSFRENIEIPISVIETFDYEIRYIKTIK